MYRSGACPLPSARSGKAQDPWTIQAFRSNRLTVQVPSPGVHNTASQGRDARIGLKNPLASPRGSWEHGKATGALTATATATPEPSGTI